jgi:putative redox protein
MSAAGAVSHVDVVWAGDRRFDAGRPGGPTLRLDGDAETGPSPVDGLMSALAACTAVDVVEILAKRRTPVTSLRISARGTRAESVPRRVTAVELTYTIDGDGIDRTHAERAAELAITKYCSVRDSLDPALPIRYQIVLNGDAGEVRNA